MKNLNIKRAGVVLLGLILLASSQLTAQVNTSEQKDQAISKQEEAYQKDRENYLNLIKEKSFTIMASTAYDEDLQTYDVDSTINFVTVNNTDILIQLVFEEVANWTRIEGITIEGEIADYQIKNIEGGGPITVVAQIASLTWGLTNVRITVFDDGMARATVDGTFGPRITFSGKFTSIEEATVVKGIEDY